MKLIGNKGKDWALLLKNFIYSTGFAAVASCSTSKYLQLIPIVALGAVG
jgi:hypothetical protein